MVHDMMLHRILRVCRVPARSRRAELGHEGIGTCRIRIALLSFVVAARHGGTAEAEKNCDGHDAESFHWGISKFQVVQATSPVTTNRYAARRRAPLNFRSEN